ncbi:SPFH domain-containing protein [Prauserella rugosa]|uniref:SPFH domain/Band 7 family protein n=1 Tax=Prauserella rugosa TaxID=43354 RepID=A0A660C738_9PSEU|nr:SPFH domain-containing protein [Prauserella rugosa]KID31514.1 SPFH domain-containing protein [Prauserella sp. Am3]TWH19338.1 SPFH domain/Band 7 family protein [Prauserella rugosa]
MDNATVVAVVTVVVVLAALVVAPKALLRVRPEQAVVVERGGRFRTVAGTGLRLLVPFVDRVRARVDLREQILRMPAQPVVTADGAAVGVVVTVRFRVTDARAAVYDRPAPDGTTARREPSHMESVERVVTTALRELGGRTAAEQLRSVQGGAVLAPHLRDRADRECAPWGVRIGEVDVTPADAPQPEHAERPAPRAHPTDADRSGHAGA